MLPQGERLEPLGASEDKTEEIVSRSDCAKCSLLEDERDVLQTSLFALTTHFAQIQFRLRQVVDAPYEDQEELLKSLDEFASTDVNLLKFNDLVGDDLMEIIKKRRQHQKNLLERLKSQLKELKNLDQLLEHLRFKEDVELQLKIQIDDLERFIDYLKTVNIRKCVCKHSKKTFSSYLIEIIQRSFSCLQLFALLQFNCGSSFFTARIQINHWGDLRAKLELAIIDLERMLQSREDPRNITLAVRKFLAPSIKDLMEHGTKSSSTLPLIDYFYQPAINSWDIILYYYHSKKGDEFNASTLQKLSRSFDLEIAGVSPQNNQKNLLYVIESIVSTHSRYKKSHDSHFKAFICAGLNTKRLVTWLNSIFHCGDIIKTFYYPWSYVASTRYQDGLRSLEVLMPYKFDLPVDLEVQKYQIEDNFFI